MEESNYWKRVFRKRLSRRTVLVGGATAALGTAGLALVGCKSGGEGGGPPAAASPGASPAVNLTPKAGGDLIQGRGVNVLGIDPHVDLTGLDIDALLYSYLYSWAPGREEQVFNNLATTFEQPDPEHLEFIFTLRPGVKIHPGGPAAGEEMTSTDVVESFKRRGTAITAPDKRFPNRIDHFETPDPYTFKFVMKRPFVPAIREMANATWAIVPAKAIEAYPNGFSQIGFGSGPFMLDSFRGAERIVLKKHPEYFLAPRPYLDSITHIVITENSSLLAAFRSGDHDVNGAFLDKSTAEDLIENPNVVVNKQPSLFYPVLHLKIKPPFDDIRVRKAINIGIDRDEILEVIQSGEGEYNGPIQWPQTKWALPQEELRAFYKYDLQQARGLLEEAGQGNLTFKMKLPKLTGPSVVGDIAAVIQDQLSRIGVTVQLDEVELGAFIGSVILPGNFDVAFFPNLPYDEPDRPLSFYHSKGVTGSGNWTNYSNPDLDAVIEAQSEEFDEAKRKELIFQAERKILEEHGPQLTLTGGYAYTAAWNYVHFGPGGFFGGPEPDPNLGPFGVDTWVDKA